MRNHKPPRVWQRMLSGRRLNLADPSPLDIELEDIALGLSKIARWNGQTNSVHSFSVAQHSVLVYEIYKILYPNSSIKEQFYALLHDAPEYVIGDMISPFKALIGAAYKDIEEKIQTAIYQSFSLPPSLNKSIKARIKRADLVSAYLEATQLAGFTKTEAAKYFRIPNIKQLAEIIITPLEPTASYEQFIKVTKQVAEQYQASRKDKARKRKQ